MDLKLPEKNRKLRLSKLKLSLIKVAVNETTIDIVTKTSIFFFRIVHNKGYKIPEAAKEPS